MHFPQIFTVLLFSTLMRTNRYFKLFSNALSSDVAHSGNDISNWEKRGNNKYVFMHHIVGNTYSYSEADWTADIRRMQASGIDALALNIGSDEWQKQQIASAYAAAAKLGTGFKLFISFDFTAIECEVADLVARVNQFADHPNQFKINGKSMVSSFSGGCLGNAGWDDLKTRTNAFLMPFIPGIEGQFNLWATLDSWLCWGCAWPQGNINKSTDDDHYYMSQLGSRYATTVSAWMFTHYSFKNLYQRGDDWLVNTRWEQLISMRDQLSFVEIVSWNDYGESHYIGPIRGDQPSGTTWVDGFPHTAWLDMSNYYITAFKSGVYPPITEDVIYYWARPYPALTSAPSDIISKPDGYNWAEDYLWVVVFATSKSTVVLRCGDSNRAFNISAGVTKLKLLLSPGQITVSMIKDGVTIIQQTPIDFTYGTNPTFYNYNAYVGTAGANSA